MIGLVAARRGARDPRLLRHRLRVRSAVPVGVSGHRACIARSAADPLHSPARCSAFAIFGIDNAALNLVVNLLILCPGRRLARARLLDVRRRAPPHRRPDARSRCATAASLFPFVGTIVYMIVRPPEYLDDVRERELEMQAAEARLHELGFHLCPHCDAEVETRLPALPELPAQAQGPVPRTARARSTRRGGSARTARPRFPASRPRRAVAGAARASRRAASAAAESAAEPTS